MVNRSDPNEEEEDELSLDKIATALENIENLGLKDEPDVQSWLNQICTSEFKLVESFLSMFLESQKDRKLVTLILRVLIKLIIYKRDMVLPIIKKDQNFCDSLINYILESDKKQLTPEPFFVLVKICADESSQNLNREDFITAILDSLTVLSDPESIYDLMKVLSKINYDSKDKSQNKFLKVIVNHDNARFFGESLLRILNYEKDKNNLFKLFQCLLDIIDITNSSFFYLSDIEGFMNIGIEILESTYTDLLRNYVLKVIERITFYDEYYQSKHKLTNLLELMENYKSNEEVDQENRKIAESILKNVLKHLEEQI